MKTKTLQVWLIIILVCSCFIAIPSSLLITLGFGLTLSPAHWYYHIILYSTLLTAVVYPLLCFACYRWSKPLLNNQKRRYAILLALFPTIYPLFSLIFFAWAMLH